MPNRPSVPPHLVFDTPMSPEKVLDTLRRKAVALRGDMTDLGASSWTLAWSAARTDCLTVLSGIRSSLVEAMESGQTAREWLRGAVSELPWQTTRGHQSNVFRTSLASAYEGQRFEDLSGNASVPYLVFDAINDDRVRETHLALDGKAWPRDKFPANYWPPLDYQCRCTVWPADRADLGKLGVKLHKGGKLPEIAPEFDHPPTFQALNEAIRGGLVARVLEMGWSAEAIPPVPPFPKDHPLTEDALAALEDVGGVA